MILVLSVYINIYKYKHIFLLRIRLLCQCITNTYSTDCFSSTDKATHPTNRQEDWEYIIGFCDQINKELEG